MALKRATSMGKFLIEIVCKYAWENGFKCDHGDQFLNFDKKLTALKGKQGLIKQNARLFRCKRCGMIFRTGARMRDGSNSLVPLGYASVGFVEKASENIEGHATVIP